MTAPSAPAFVLASSSPRRRELLARLGLRFEVVAADVDETPRRGEAAIDLVRRLAREKAERVAATRDGAAALVLAADTVVVLRGRILGKPADPDDARRMLRALSGEEHEVLTGLALVDTARARTAATVERTLVRFSAMDEDEIARYVATGEPLDKAGAYGVQGIGGLWVESIAGNYTNVVGLPLPAVRRLFAEVGHDLHAFTGE